MPEELKVGDILTIASTNLLNPLRTDEEIELAFEVGDIVSFPPLSRKFRVVNVRPFTIEPLEPIRCPQRYLVRPEKE